MKKQWKKAFLAALEETGSVTEAAKICDVGRSNLYRIRRGDKQFAAEWDQALDVAADVLEDEARRRAVEGTEEPVFQGGKQVGTIRKYSDTLLIFLLKGIRPQKYRESRASIPPAELDKLIQAELEAREKAIKLRLEQEKQNAEEAPLVV